MSRFNFALIQTKQPNMPTIQVSGGDKKLYLYSKYNPAKDSEAFAKEVYDENIENYLVYGLGLGYHIEKLEKLLKDKKEKYHIYIVECNNELFKIANKNIDLKNILDNENITFIMMKNNKDSYDKLRNILSVNNMKVSIHKPSLNIVSEEFIELKYLLEEYQVKRDTIDVNKHLLESNFKENITLYDENVDVLFNKYKNKPLFLISAGPSLDKNIYELSKVKKRGIILAVGRAVRPLLLANIIPDYIVITDPSDYLYDMQLKDLDINVPIIVLSTCNKDVMLNYKGYKYIALQEGYNLAEEYARFGRHKLVETGGSVATTSLDIAINMGCNPIAFVGQDLAFTDGQSHSKDTFSKGMANNSKTRTIKDIDGNEIKTFKNLTIYLRWIQNRISREKDIEFIDATEGGAKIKGTKPMKLKDLVDMI